ncbi:protein of unknown function [Cupriavidus taiwanensis]|uniref:Uncharacterized protein n=1 Tax=Cupriavidus taiwanensis TaxID=164546 RepID=A0A9Q7UV48_9BURK|nr:protein of unknown function [Cupriavidus taiwanensis]
MTKPPDRRAENFAKLSSEVMLCSNRYRTKGRRRNISAPLTRCRMDTLPAQGNRYFAICEIPIFRNSGLACLTASAMRDPISGKQRNETAIACMQRDALGQIHEILAPLLRAAPIIFCYHGPTSAARQSHTPHIRRATSRDKQRVAQQPAIPWPNPP